MLIIVSINYKQICSRFIPFIIIIFLFLISKKYEVDYRRVESFQFGFYYFLVSIFSHTLKL